MESCPWESVVRLVLKLLFLSLLSLRTLGMLWANVFSLSESQVLMTLSCQAIWNKNCKSGFPTVANVSHNKILPQYVYVCWFLRLFKLELFYFSSMTIEDFEIKCLRLHEANRWQIHLLVLRIWQLKDPMNIFLGQLQGWMTNYWRGREVGNWSSKVWSETQFHNSHCVSHFTCFPLDVTIPSPSSQPQMLGLAFKHPACLAPACLFCVCVFKFLVSAFCPLKFL